MIIFDASERSVVGRIDPRLRVVAAIALALLVCLSESLAVLAASLGAAIVLAVLARLHVGRALRNLRQLNFFMLLLVILLPLMAGGEAAVRLGPIAWSRQGLHKAAMIALRANIIMIALTALLATMEPAHLGMALRRIGVPEKLTHVLLFMIRYIEVIHHEYHRLRDALRLRGFRPGCNRHTFRTFGYLVAVLLLRSIDRSERIVEAMKCRGFRGRFYVLSQFKFAAADAVFAVAAAGCVAVLGWMEWS